MIGMRLDTYEILFQRGDIGSTFTRTSITLWPKAEWTRRVSPYRVYACDALSRRFMTANMNVAESTQHTTRIIHMDHRGTLIQK